MERQAPEHEILIVRGRLDRVDNFTPSRCLSTSRVRQWPDVNDTSYVVELLDQQGMALDRSPAEVVLAANCDPGAPPIYRLRAYIRLHPLATKLILRTNDRVLWEREIPGAASVEIELQTERISREEPVAVRVAFSEPDEGAYIQMLYQWGRRKYSTLYILPPAPEMTVDLRHRPGGTSCRLLVIYSNGLRAAGAATQEFALPPLGPTVTILAPNPDSELLPGQPLVLQGQVLDPERLEGPPPSEDLVWLVDGEEVGRGPISGVSQLSTGAHRVELRYGADRSVEATATVRVTPVEFILANEWEPWDEWSDEPAPRAASGR